MSTQPVDAYEYCGPLDADHPAVKAGLTGNTSDDGIDHIEARLLLTYGEPPFNITTLGPALATWRDDLNATDD